MVPRTPQRAELLLRVVLDLPFASTIRGAGVLLVGIVAWVCRVVAVGRAFAALSEVQQFFAIEARETEAALASPCVLALLP